MRGFAIWDRREYMGALQLFGIVSSGHPNYPVTGSFYNPGPYGCLIGTIVPMSVWLWHESPHRVVRSAAMTYILLAALLLPGGMSRTGWIAALIGTAVVAYGWWRSRLNSISGRRLIVLCAAALTAVCTIGSHAVDEMRREAELYSTAINQVIK